MFKYAKKVFYIVFTYPKNNSRSHTLTRMTGRGILRPFHVPEKDPNGNYFFELFDNMRISHMLFDTLKNALRYPLGPVWTAVFHEAMLLAEHGASLSAGRYELAGGPERGGVTADVNIYDTKPEGRYESHRVMADIQIVLDGEEECRVLSVEPELPGAPALTPEAPYDADRDIVFYREMPEAAARLRLRSGFFALLLPQDAHAPALAVSTPGRVKKLVVKVPAAALFRHV